MRMLTRTKTLIADEDGAVTVDWVVLSAAVLGIGFVVLGPIAFSANNATDDVAADILAVESPYMRD